MTQQFAQLIRQRLLAMGLVAIAVIVAGGCLPSGTRGSHATSSDGSSGRPEITPVPTPAGPTPRPSYVPPTPTPLPSFLVYVVAAGDSLNTIAHKYGTSARSIAFWNRATYPSLDPDGANYRPNLLQRGWTLSLIPNVIVNEDELPAPSDTASPSESDAG